MKNLSDLGNIKDYIAKAVVLKNDLPKLENLNDKYAKFTLLFPSVEDKIICKAIFDMLFISDNKVRAFVTQMTDQANALFPQKASDLVDVYNQTIVLMGHVKEKYNKKVSDDGGEKNSSEEKQGGEKDDEKHGRAADQFVVMNTVDPNRENNTDKEQPAPKKIAATVSVISKEELEKARLQQDLAEKMKKEECEKQTQEEIEKRIKYERELAEKRQKQQQQNSLKELEQAMVKKIDIN